MKVEHDSDSEDIVMEDDCVGNEAAHTKQGSAAPQELTSSPHNAASPGSHTGAEEASVTSASSMEVTQDVSQEATEPREDKDMNIPPTLSDMLPSPSSPCSSTSSHDEPLTPTSSSSSDGISKADDAQTSSLPTASPSSRSNKDQASGSHVRSTRPPHPSPSTPTYPSALPMSSIIHSNESVYAAVPTSSEVYIIPKSSRGFNWNGDLFLKPHQRRSLGVDHMFTMGGQQHGNLGSGNSSGISSHMNGPQQNQHHHSQDSSIFVHEIRLDDQETAGILPSWP
ncbi:hypothetical protein BGX34_009589 [Mortierella sp. NVP85]|nr:hypothetical protein BGX34_009589 [Mortierella sp. NVP85]